MVIRLGQRYGFKTLNVVRRQELAEELRRAGGTAAVATDAEPLAERVRDLTGGEGVPFVLDAVGGATGSAAVALLSRGGRALVYGRLSGEPLTLDPITLLVGQKRVEGFWLSEWVRNQNSLTMLLLFRRLGRLIRGGELATEDGPVFPLDKVREATREADKSGRRGKVLLRIGNR
jgi:NADPH:quinone reductase-like Zn-dependent oxidoreductase